LKANELKYKLSIVEMDEKNPRKELKETCVVGYFSSESELEIWARENYGELARC